MSCSRHVPWLFGLINALAFTPAWAQDPLAYDTAASVTAVVDMQDVATQSALKPNRLLPAAEISPHFSTQLIAEALTTSSGLSEASSAPGREVSDSSQSMPTAEAGANEKATEHPTTPAVTTIEPAANNEAKRTNRIRDIVSEAIKAPSHVSKRMLPPPEDVLEQQPQQNRRQAVAKAVSNAAEATVTPADSFLQVLRQEGKQTVVIDEETARRPAVAPTATEPSPRSTASIVSTYAGRTYQVRAGDSLWLIAQRLYGDGYRYLELYEANKARLSDKNVLAIGQRLNIP